MNLVSIYLTTVLFIPCFSDTRVKRYDKTSLITDEIWEEKIFENSIKTSLITCLGQCMAWPGSGKICKNGDGIGGQETLIGKSITMEDCIRKVKAAHPNANGVTMVHPCSEAADDPYCGNCFAEFDMDDWNDSKRHRACKFYTGIEIFEI